MRITLRCSSGYLTAEGGGALLPQIRPVTANRPVAGAWETWTVEKNGDGIALKSINGCYLCAEGGGGSAVHANRATAQEWERWTPIPALVDGQAIALRSVNGRSLSVSKMGDHVVDAIGEATTFTVEVIEADAPPVPQPGPVTAPPIARASRLHTNGNELSNEQGQRVMLNGASFFAAPWLVCERGHAAVAPSMRELRERYNVNCLVEFCMSVNVQKNLFGGADPCDPSKYGDRYFDLLGEHADRAAELGQYLYLVAGPDHGLIPAYASQAQFRDFWSRLLAWARGVPNVLLKPTNEGFAKPENFVDVYGLEFPDFCPVAATDYGGNDEWWSTGTYPKFSDWGGTRSCGDIHPPRTGTPIDARECVAINNVYYEHNRCLFISEAIRLGSNGSAGATRKLAELVGAASRVGAAMRVFHSLLGEQCQPFDDQTHDHADAYFAVR